MRMCCSPWMRYPAAGSSQWTLAQPITSIVKNGSIPMGGALLPMRPYGVAFTSDGRLVYTDAKERTVREVRETKLGRSLVLVAGSGDSAERNGAAATAAFVQPTGIAADGRSLLVTDVSTVR